MIMKQDKLRILAVEDNSVDFRLLQEYLKEGFLTGFEIAHAKTLEEAFRFSASKKFDVILLDLALPDGMGLGNVEKMHNNSPSIPIIVLTGLDDEKIGISALSKNAQDYLVKSKIESGILVRSIRYAIQRHKIEEELKETHDYLKRLIEYANAPIIVWDKSLRVTFFNRAFERLTSYEAPEVLGKKVTFIFPGTAKEQILEEIRDTASGKHWESVEMPILCKNKGIRIVLWSSASIYKEGALHSTIAQGQDITDRKTGEQLLQKAHDELEEKVLFRTRDLDAMNKQLIHEISKRKETEYELSARNELLKLLNKEVSRKTYIDDVVKLIKNWSKCRYVGIRILDEEGSIPYESYADFSDEFLRSENCLSVKTDNCVCVRVIKGKPDQADRPFIGKSGAFYCGDSSDFLKKLSKEDESKFRGVCLRNGFRTLAVIPVCYRDKIVGAIHLADKEPDKIGSVLRELIEGVSGVIGEAVNKFNLEDKIEKDHILLDTFFQHSVSPLAFLDKKLNFIRVNAAYARVFKKEPAEFKGHSYFKFYPREENEEMFNKVIESRKPFQVFAKPFMYPGHPSWRVIYWDLTLTPILDQNDEVSLLVFSLIDVTERKQNEEKLKTTQKELEHVRRLSDIGTLAATVAHELRNPLAAINMASYNIKRKAQNPLLEKHLATIEKKVNESDQIINNLLFYSRLKLPQYENINIFEIIEECIAIARNRHKKNKISVEVELKPLKNISIKADPLQIKEVFSNILGNAFEAIIDGHGAIGIHGSMDNNFIKISVKDSGVGISSEDAQKVFDPFFTTKAKGTGLGLTVCKQIIGFHGGMIDIISQKGKGSSIIIKLPLYAEK